MVSQRRSSFSLLFATKIMAHLLLLLLLCVMLRPQSAEAAGSVRVRSLLEESQTTLGAMTITNTSITPNSTVADEDEGGKPGNKPPPPPINVDDGADDNVPTASPSVPSPTTPKPTGNHANAGVVRADCHFDRTCSGRAAMSGVDAMLCVAGSPISNTAFYSMKILSTGGCCCIHSQCIQAPVEGYSADACPPEVLAAVTGASVRSIEVGEGGKPGGKPRQPKIVNNGADLRTPATTRKPTSKPTSRPTIKPTSRRPTAKPTSRRPTAKPTSRRPTSKPTSRRPTTKPTSSRPTLRPTRNPTTPANTGVVRADCHFDRVCGGRAAMSSVDAMMCVAGSPISNTAFYSMKILSTGKCCCIHSLCIRSPMEGYNTEGCPPAVLAAVTGASARNSIASGDLFD